MTNISYIQKTNLRVACAGGVGGTQDVYYPKGNLREGHLKLRDVIVYQPC